MRRYMAKNKQEMKWAFSLFDQVHSKDMNPNLKYKLKQAQNKKNKEVENRRGRRKSVLKLEDDENHRAFSKVIDPSDEVKRRKQEAIE